MRFELRTWLSMAVVLAGLVLGACSQPIVLQVDDDAYEALVPTPEQFVADVARDIPGGFAGLRDTGIDQIELRIDGDEATFRLNGTEAVKRQVVDRVELTDRDGSGPFKAKKQILVLGDEALVLGDLVIDEPVIWPGSFAASPVITLKPHDPEERGPDVSCRSDEQCLLLTSGADPVGRYENVNNPELGMSPVESIQVTDEVIEFNLAAGHQVQISRRDGSLTRACGLSTSAMWDVPAEVDLAMDDPVLVHSVCPSTPGGAVQLTIIERAEIPLLAPLGTEGDEGWCMAGVDCLWFLPI